MRLVQKGEEWEKERVEWTLKNCDLGQLLRANGIHTYSNMQACDTSALKAMAKEEYESLLVEWSEFGELSIDGCQ